MSGEGAPSTILVDADDDLLACFDRAKARRVRLDELLLDVAALDRFDCAAPAQDLLHFGPCRLDELLRACASTTSLPLNRSAYSRRSVS